MYNPGAMNPAYSPFGSGQDEGFSTAGYMRKRLGLGTMQPTPPQNGGIMPPNGPGGRPYGNPTDAPTGFNPHPFHPVFNPVGWQNHPMNSPTGSPMPNFNPYVY